MITETPTKLRFILLPSNVREYGFLTKNKIVLSKGLSVGSVIGEWDYKDKIFIDNDKIYKRIQRG